METCLLGSTQLGNGANINSIDTLGKVVSRLPVHLRSKWAEKASQLYDKHVTPDFSHLTEFVQSRAAVANTYFGQIIGSKVDMRKDGGDKGRRNPPFFKGNNTSLATYGQNVEDVGNESKGRNLLCVLCKGSHHLERCHKFRAQNLQQRRDLIKSKRVCHACLSPGHFVKNCRGARMCGVEGCQRRHHPLLHSSEKEVKPPQADPGAESGSAPENNRSTQDMQSGGHNLSGVGATNSSSRSYPSTHNLREKWKLAHKLADEFWARWLKEYLPSLQERQRWLFPRRNLTKGDIVLMVKEDSPRGEWPLAAVEESYPDKNGHVRQMLIRAANQTQYRRDVRKLCLLEKSDSE
ncbi:Hypothetical predicted protein [Paramuricea clavata]|uniref:Uncharacterized protein n=1 Tax=Paramuricea clavata TaxID=317549 RepID=A0A7D9HZ27_PARCT|nr:Hypothetical predicted protein [Paramuricea clavata]